MSKRREALVLANEAMLAANREAVTEYMTEVEDDHRGKHIEADPSKFVPMLCERAGWKLEEITKFRLGVIFRTIAQQCVDAYGPGHLLRILRSEWSYKRDDIDPGFHEVTEAQLIASNGDPYRAGRDSYRRYYLAFWGE